MQELLETPVLYSMRTPAEAQVLMTLMVLNAMARRLASRQANVAGLSPVHDDGAPSTFLLTSLDTNIKTVTRPTCSLYSRHTTGAPPLTRGLFDFHFS